MINLRGIDLNLLVVFEAIYGNESLTQAGSQIGMTQPAMSNALSRLRHATKDELFIRHGRTLLPTSKAKELQPQVSEALGILRKALSPAEQFELIHPVTFNLVGIDLLELDLIPKVIADNPEVAQLLVFNIDSRWADNVEEKLASNEYDLLLDFQAPVSASLESLELGRFPFIAMARKGHPLSNKKLTPNELSHCQFAALSPVDKRPVFIEQVLMEKGLSCNISVRVTNHPALGHFLTQTDYIGLVPENISAPIARQFDLVTIDTELHEIWAPNILVWHSSLTHDPVNRWLREKIIEQYNKASPHRVFSLQTHSQA